MNQEQKQRLLSITSRRTRIAVILTAIMCVTYFGFILLVAFDKELMGTLVSDGRISVGIILGALTILTAPILTGIYVRWANRKYDAIVASIVEQEGKQ